MNLIEQVKSLQDSPIFKLINKKLKEFDNSGKKGTKTWFSELYFCILTENYKAQTVINIQEELGYKCFATYSKEKISETIRRNKHYFHNNKSILLF